MFRLTTAPTVALEGEEDLAAEADEPPDDQLSPLQTNFPTHDILYKKASRPGNDRRESLLTKALMSDSASEDHSPTSARPAPRGSTTSTYSTASLSTAELTSDTGITTPPRSATPSPRLPSTHKSALPKSIPSPDFNNKENQPSTGNSGGIVTEKPVEKKRCIRFACGKPPDHDKKPAVEAQKVEQPATEPPKRTCRLTFACPMQSNKKKDLASEVLKIEPNSARTSNQASPSPVSAKLLSPQMKNAAPPENKSPTLPTIVEAPVEKLVAKDEEARNNSFHEFASPNDATDAWVQKSTDAKPKLTMSDCMRKENAIRQLGKEAEEEADEEEQEQDDLEENDDLDEDDFAPSDGSSSDDGNESDDEGGFADSDDESDAGSDYHFWAPSKATSTTTAATSNENLIASHFSNINSKHHSVASSFESGPSGSLPRQLTPRHAFKHLPRGRAAKAIKMRPSTPELPDSTDFVCGTFDEDRPLEAAYISCREMKKREKHVPVPQDIDPSFPTTDPENNDNDDEEDDAETDDHIWLKDQLDGFDEDTARGRKKTVAKSPAPSPKRLHSPAPKSHVFRPVPQRPAANKRNTNRSPPPKQYLRHPSPPPRRLFGQSPTRLRSPPPHIRLRSPRGSPTGQIRQVPLGITINRLAQRPGTGRTSSLPHTPNPFFRNYKPTSRQPSNFTSGAVTPISEIPDGDRHIRGAVDIVIGLEKKRQKRKEKFWRQHSRKAAREQAERKPIPGKGAERMRELGLECAERTKGYGLVQPAQLVISL